jgi:hypothetical protein
MRFAPLIVVATLSLPSLASAQPALAIPEVERHGLFAGGGLWGGNISCDGSDCGGFREAGGANGHVGYLFGPNFGILIDAWAMTSSKNDVSITYVVGTINARLWLTPRVWVQGGVGNGHAEVRVNVFGVRGDDVPVGELAAGVELVRGPNWALDLSGRVAQGKSTEANGDVTTGRAAGVGVSMTWYAHRPTGRAIVLGAR